MSEESDAYLARARELLDRGSRIADTLGYFAVSGRDAYMAAFNAAQAVIFARTGRVAKTHSGVRSEISRLAHHDARIDPSFATFLAQGYRLKEIDDYQVTPAVPTSRQTALSALATATRLVAHAEWPQPDLPASP